MFYYTTFFIHQNFRTDLTCMWVQLNETLIFMSKFSMEAFLEINYELVFQRKEGHIFS